MKTTVACNYAVIQFLPYRETGEFVNVGVALFCPQTGFFGAKVETRKQRRVTNFFPELDKELFRQGRQTFETELQRVQDLLARDECAAGDTAKLAVFRELVKPRESVFRFGQVATVLAEDPAAKLDQLFAHLVNRQFAQVREYQETIMARSLTSILRAHELEHFYRANQKVGNADFHVVLPIVSTAQSAAGVVRRAIKPLDLDRDEPTKIYEHGDAWIKRVERLRQIDRLPEGFLFTLRYPTEGEKQQKAATEIEKELRKLDVHVLPFDDEKGVLEFANLEAQSG